MSSFLNPHNATSLTGVVDIAAHSISLFQENDEPPQNIKDTSIPKSDTSVAEAIDVKIDELGNNVITMYQFIGPTNDEKVLALEPVLTYMSENHYSKDEPAINQHNYYITRKQHNPDFSTHSIYNVDKSTSYKTKNHNFNDTYFYKRNNHKEFNEPHNQSK